MAGSKRKLEKLLMENDTATLSTKLGNNLTGKDLQDEVKNHRLATFRKYFGYLSKYEAEIKRRILSYDIELKESNYQLVAERLRRDQFSAFVYIHEWEGILYSGWKYKDSHSFIVMENVQGNERGKEKLIVDLNFQSQFSLSSPSPAYESLWSSLPNIFVGTEEKLTKIIAIICSCAQQPIPHYLKLDFLLSKWLSPNRKLQQ